MSTTAADDQLVSTNEVARRYATHGDTVRSWIRNGVTAACGARIRLRAIRIGGRWKVAESDLETFQRLCQGEEITAPPRPETASEKQLRRDRERLDRLLAKRM